ncbi:hypothetical protein AVEN_206900-1 [Araneus ventricosus]|uniref:Uncharacterized protein n=1 Tax=Araneus ventricosus TaxID=182803 RepID=A0A4Y2TI69_ARAVE|nr:hypothetical protein AVEN_69601-1 [Araneus ventricosus]GBO00326.1 hypothetical protein AVEN_206900-1 [Araneus ventricosus]
MKTEKDICAAQRVKSPFKILEAPFLVRNYNRRSKYVPNLVAQGATVCPVERCILCVTFFKSCSLKNVCKPYHINPLQSMLPEWRHRPQRVKLRNSMIFILTVHQSACQEDNMERIAKRWGSFLN